MSFAFLQMFRGVAVSAALASAMLGAGPAQSEPPDVGGPVPQLVTAMDSFLDRLMLAESGGRDHIRNPRSTAYGPFQFLDQTFLELVRRHFQAETAALTPAQILALRADREFSRRVAAAFTEENARILAANGLAASWPNLRLAFFAGPAGAVRVLKGPAEASVLAVLGPAVIRANPFLSRMTAADLAAWSAHTIAGRRGVPLPSRIAAASPPPPVVPAEPGTAHKRELPPVAVRIAIAVRVPPPRLGRGRLPRDLAAVVGAPSLAVVGAPASTAPPVRVTPPCNVALASCRHWLALAERRLVRQRQAALRGPAPATGAARR